MFFLKMKQKTGGRNMDEYFQQVGVFVDSSNQCWVRKKLHRRISKGETSVYGDGPL